MNRFNTRSNEVHLRNQSNGSRIWYQTHFQATSTDQCLNGFLWKKWRINLVGYMLYWDRQIGILLHLMVLSSWSNVETKPSFYAHYHSKSSFLTLMTEDRWQSVHVSETTYIILLLLLLSCCQWIMMVMSWRICINHEI